MELEHLVNIWVRLVFLPVFTFVANFVSEGHYHEGVGGAVVVTLCQVEGTHNVEAHVALGLLHKEALDDLVRLNIYDLPKDLQVRQFHLSDHLLEHTSSFVVQNSARKAFEFE